MMQLVFGLRMNEQDACSQCFLHKTTARDTVRGGVRFTLVAFENFSTLFSPSDFTSYNMGGTADSTAVDRRVYFPQFFAFPQFPCIFFIHAKIHLNQRGKEMKLRGSCAKLSPQANISAFASFYMKLMEFMCSSSSLVSISINATVIKFSYWQKYRKCNAARKTECAIL